MALLATHPLTIQTRERALKSPPETHRRSSSGPGMITMETRRPVTTHGAPRSTTTVFLTRRNPHHTGPMESVPIEADTVSQAPTTISATRKINNRLALRAYGTMTITSVRKCGDTASIFRLCDLYMTFIWDIERAALVLLLL